VYVGYWFHWQFCVQRKKQGSTNEDLRQVYKKIKEGKGSGNEDPREMFLERGEKKKSFLSQINFRKNPFYNSVVPVVLRLYTFFIL
tara:strand:- start:23 stop:280 length:258 start_codon:yes stop_codon:yes gene_type:complete